MLGYRITIIGTVKTINKFRPADMTVFLTRQHAEIQARRYRRDMRELGVIWSMLYSPNRFAA